MEVDFVYLSTFLRYESASNRFVGLESLLMSNIAKCSWNPERIDVSRRLGTSQGFDLAILPGTGSGPSLPRLTGRFGTCAFCKKGIFGDFKPPLPGFREGSGGVGAPSSYLAVRSDGSRKSWFSVG